MFSQYRQIPAGIEDKVSTHLRYMIPPVPTLPTVKFLPSFSVARISGPHTAARDLVRSRKTSLLFLTRRSVLLFFVFPLFPCVGVFALTPSLSSLRDCAVGLFVLLAGVEVVVGVEKVNLPPLATTICLTTAGSTDINDFPLGD